MNPVRRLRVQTGLTQTQLAVGASTSQPTIASYEAGTKSPTLETLEKIARSLGFDVSVSFVPALSHEDRRSLAYHQAVMEKLRNDPSILKRARHNLSAASRQHPHVKTLFDEWKTWLALPLDELIGRCLDESIFARDMRQVTPFAGVLSAAERFKIIKKLRGT